MIIIVGAGLSGLLLAYRLKNANIPFRILEARKRIGGRIHTVSGANETPVEMGATWFHQEHRHFLYLLSELDIPFYEQFMDGTAFFQAHAGVPAESFIMPDQTPSYRISGGTMQLIKKLESKLDREDIFLDQPVEKVDFFDDEVRVKARETFVGQKIILALPPKLWQETISFSPELPQPVMQIASETQTWMEESIKVGVIYEEPFWRKNLQSGTLFSNVGPMTELYDHSNENVSRFALCGFLHSQFRSLAVAERKRSVIQQLVASFGNEASEVLDHLELDWSREVHTSGSLSRPLFPHQNNGNGIYQNALFDNRLFFAGTEVSPHHGGYMEGAVYNSMQVFAKILRSVQR